VRAALVCRLSSSSLQVLISNLYFFKRTLLKKYLFIPFLFVTIGYSRPRRALKSPTLFRFPRTLSLSLSLSLANVVVVAQVLISPYFFKRDLSTSTDQKYLLNVPFFYILFWILFRIIQNKKSERGAHNKIKNNVSFVFIVRYQ